MIPTDSFDKISPTTTPASPPRARQLINYFPARKQQHLAYLPSACVIPVMSISRASQLGAMALATHLMLLFLAFAIHFTTCTANLPPGVAGPRWPSFFEAPEFHLNIAKRDMEEAFMPEHNAPGPRWPTIFEAPHFHLNIAKKDTEGVFKGDDNAPGPRWPTIFEAPDFHLNIAANDILNAVGGIIRNTGAWVAQADEDLHRDPGGTILRAAWDVAKVGIVIAPALIWGPALNLLGFGMGGVGQGTAAAAAQSAAGAVAARSPFAFLQSAAAGGYGVAAMNALTRGGVLLFEGGKWVIEQLNNTGM
ncbi:hypothetical protein F5B21DRAFT_490904 [Xylaria acuta]|nr:hypothetical protein F5B21DRAFT_490904 [Xylaria acuta]